MTDWTRTQVDFRVSPSIVLSALVFTEDIIIPFCTTFRETWRAMFLFPLGVFGLIFIFLVKPLFFRQLHLLSCFGTMPAFRLSQIPVPEFILVVSVWLKNSSEVSPENSWNLLEASILSFSRLNGRVETQLTLFTSSKAHFKIQGSAWASFHWFLWL